MTYDFDRRAAVRNKESVKWNVGEGILPLGIADMDFETVPEIVQAIRERASRDLFVYTNLQEDHKPALIDWYGRRHGWTIREDWLCISPGVSPAIGIAIRAFAHPGDKVILQSPVYPPFFNEIRHNGCEVVDNPLLLTEDGYRIDFEDLERKASDLRTKILLLCNPHNPVGRVWTREELARIGEICLRHDVLVIADEIHGDLVYGGHRYVPFASVSEELAGISVTCTAPSKTFNLAGIQASNIVIPNQRLRKDYEIGRNNIGISRLNVFASAACTAAYRHGEAWLDQALAYLEGNRDYALGYLRERLPMVAVAEPEGTYLLWMDFRKTGLSDEELHRKVLEEAGLVLNEGRSFGPGGTGFQRLNLACPRSVLAEALERLRRAFSVQS